MLAEHRAFPPQGFVRSMIEVQHHVRERSTLCTAPENAKLSFTSGRGAGRPEPKFDLQGLEYLPLVIRFALRMQSQGL